MQANKKHALTDALVSLFKQRMNNGSDRCGENNLQSDISSLVDRTFTDELISERKQVNILLADLRGFTALTSVCEASELVELLNRYLQKMSEVVLRYNGTIDKFMGDSIMCLFGAPESHPDDLERCLACAVEMQLAMNDINETNMRLGLPEIFMGIGINSGHVMAGSVGSELHSEYTVIGKEVNIASRIEAHSLRGQILLAENTYKQAKDYIDIGGVREVRVKGRKDMVRMFELRSTHQPTHLEVPVREARSSPRVEVDLPLRYQLLDGKTLRKEIHRGRIVDLSYGGLRARNPQPLDEHSEICIKLSLSLMSNETSDTYARVLRVRETDHGEYEFQTEFTMIEEPARRELKSFVDQIVETA